MRNEAAAAGKGPGKESIWQFFVDKCANNLHIVLTMSPVGDTLRTRCRNFPGEHVFQPVLFCLTHLWKLPSAAPDFM